MPDFVGPINWLAVLPEIILCSVASLVLVITSGNGGRAGSRTLGFSLLGAVGAFVAAWMLTPGPDAFSGAIAVDGLSRVFSLILAGSAVLTILITAGYTGRWEVQSGEYYALILFATSGMMIMSKGMDMMTIFIGLEVSSISQYILAAFRWHQRRSVEASIKYLLLGAFASGFLLYGIALTYGATGSIQLRDMAAALGDAGVLGNPLLLAGIGFIVVGFGFKVSAVPFHMWTPDVYQGAPTAVTAFMAAGPKVAGFAALVRILGFGFGAARPEWSMILWWLAVLTMTAGNILALVQSDMKRMLAYSSIAHAGYLLVSLVAGAEWGSVGTLYYMVAYALTTLGAFGVVALVRNEEDGGTAIENFAGIGYARPWVGLAMAVFMFSLGGIPPTAGFVGKFYIFGGAVREGFVTLAVIGVLNSVVSMYYYLRVVVAMYMRPAAAGESPLIPANRTITAALAIAVLGILVFGVYPGPLYATAQAAVQGLGL
jgi:NADH-quinone oxidoreductase subunit N